MTVDSLLGSGDGTLEELTLWGEVETVVEDLGVADGDELITESTDLLVEDETLQIDMGGAEDGKTGGFVASTGLDADESVLDNVDTSNTVLAGKGVGSKEEVDGLSVDLVANGELDWETLLEFDGEVLWGLWGIEWVDGELPHLLWWGDVWILKDTGLVRAVSHVLIHGPWGLLGLNSWDALLGGVVQKVVTSSEAGVELWDSPWGNDLDVWLQGVESQLETDLVVTLSGAAVRDGNTALLLGDGDLSTGNDWASQRGTEEVDVLVDGVALDSWEAKLLNELLAQILDVDLGGTDCFR